MVFRNAELGGKTVNELKSDDCNVRIPVTLWRGQVDSKMGHMETLLE